MTLEDKLSEVGRHFKTLGATSYDGISLLAEAPTSVIQLRKIIEAGNFGLVVIDTMILGVRGLTDLNDYLQVSQSIAPYVQLARETNSHILMIHHLSKRERGGGDQILGSTALFGSVDSVLLLDRQKQQRIFSTIMRYGKDLPQSVIMMTDNGLIQIVDTCDSQNLIGTQILNCLDTALEPITEKQIDLQVYGRTSEKRKQLRLLLTKGEIVRLGKGTKSNEYRYSRSRPY